MPAATRRSWRRRRWGRWPAGWRADSAASVCPVCDPTMYEGPVQDLIDELGRLPGVGPKSAQRIAFHLLGADPVDTTRLITALQKVKEGVVFCDLCGNVSEETRCRICRDARRDQSSVC